MTAPDPGLTDLIAAHTLRVVELNEAARYPECNGCDWVGGLVRDHAAHLALVVEQHGPNAAVAIADARRWEARAEKVEATIARVHAQTLLLALDGHHEAANRVRAALEGE